MTGCSFSHFTGWRRRGLAMLLGFFAVAALPPIYLLLFLVLSFSGFFLLLLGAQTARQAFLDGWWWGLGYFTAGLYWVCISLYVEPEKFAWLTPFALFGLPSILGIYTGLVTLVFYVVSSRLRAVWKHAFPVTQGLLFIFPTLFVAAEYLRAHLFTGFPWNLIGYVWTAYDETLQLASVIGIYGLSWIAVFVAVVPALFVTREKPFLPSVLAVLLVAFMVGFGWLRLEHNPTRYSTVKIRIVQPNIAQNVKWSAEASLGILKKHSDLTRLPGLDSINIVIWPEAALPYYVQPDSELVHILGDVLPPNALLMTGGLRGGSDSKNWQAWNSLFVINHEGRILAQYDKHHLVPFGEFIPFRRILPVVENISGGHGDFMSGGGAATVTVDSVPPFSPLICYEAIFPDEATDNTHKAQWLLNITNDAWFGISSGPYQHLQMARVRAVENGLPLVRAANTGISSVIDPVGRVIAWVPLETETIIDFYLPLPTPKVVWYTDNF